MRDLTDKLSYAIIRSAVEKGIRDIQADPGRGVRGLIDLGEMFAIGRFQKDFFQVAQQMVDSPDSCYYQLVDRTVRSVDKDLLVTFGMNLGYNSWTRGASLIRETEDREGFNIPWMMVLDLLPGDGSAQVLPAGEIARVLREGRALGTYCYCFFLPEGYPAMEELLSVLGAEPDCAFVLFLPPALADEALVQKIHRLGTIFAAVDLDAGQPEETRRATRLLLEHRCLCGGFTRRADLVRALDSVREEEAPLPFLFFLREASGHTPEDGGDIRVEKIREQLRVPVFPVDFYEDIAHIDRNISSEACLITIRSDGRVAATQDGGRAAGGLNIYTTPLRDILKSTAPKRGRSTPGG